MIVHFGELANLKEIVDFLIDKFHASYGDFFPPVDRSKVIFHVARHLHHGAVFIVRDQYGAIGGVIGGAIATPWFSTTQFLAEGFFFVDPTMRRTRAAVVLLHSLSRYAKDRDIKLVTGVSSGDRLEEKDRFYAMNGLERIGGLYQTRTISEKKEA